MVAVENLIKVRCHDPNILLDYRHDPVEGATNNGVSEFDCGRDLHEMKKSMEEMKKNSDEMKENLDEIKNILFELIGQKKD